MAITDKEQGVWELSQVYNKIKAGSIWNYTGETATMTWGQNSYGYRGLNDVVVRSSPTQLPGTWTLGRGSYQPSVTLATNSDGELFVWGGGWYGSTGLNDTVHRSSPTQIPGTNWGTDATKMFSGGDQTFAIKTDGTMWSWGRNQFGALAQNVGTYLNDECISSPTQVGTDTTWSEIGAGTASSFAAIKTDGTLWTWGSNGNGALGRSDIGPNPNNTARSSPVQVPGTTWSKLAKGQGFAGRTDGSLYVWGFNGDWSHGRLGLNDKANRSSPTQIPGTWTSFDSNIGVSAGIKGGELYTWGNNTTGGLGHNSTTSYSSPTQVGSESTWNEVLAGGYPNTNMTTLATKTDGSLWAWGINYMGMLGLNKTQSDLAALSSPTQIPGTWSNPGDGMYGFYAQSTL